jgi:hypothetical protein
MLLPHALINPSLPFIPFRAEAQIDVQVLITIDDAAWHR